ncbi:MAG: helix-turn-helix transcriptional regulator [Clostridia bacterium]|nr:helix-turn-helix transcriptional regulator [Clostridia bacterium]
MLGDRLRAIRKEHGLTQQNIADVLGVDRTTYTVYEGGSITPSPATLVKLSQIYNVTVGYLIGVEENHPELRKIPDEKQEKKLLSSDPISLLKKEEKELLLYFRVLSDAEKHKIIDEMKDLAQRSGKL